jgi:hypothetical protein
MSQDDEFVDDLLKGLSKAAPMSEFELRKFERLIDRQTEEYKKTQHRNRFKMPASIAASIVVAFGIILTVSNHGTNSKVITSVVNPNTITNSETKSNVPSSMNPSTKPPLPNRRASSGDGKNSRSPNQLYGNSNTSNGVDGSVAKFETNLDYMSDLPIIKSRITLASKPASISSLDYLDQQCAIKQGISDSLLAFDRGYYQEQRVLAYFSGKSKKDYKIILVDSDCNLIATL